MRDVRDCYAEADRAAAEQRAEIHAEAVMSWVAGGGAPEDAGRYAAVVAAGGTWDGGIGDPPADEGTCDHGGA